MTGLDIVITIWIVGALLTVGVLLGVSFANMNEEGSLWMYAIWFAPVWPVLLLVLIPGLLAYRMMRVRQ